MKLRTPTPEVTASFAKYVRSGLPLDLAAQLLSQDPKTVKSWMRRTSKKCKAFAAVVEEARTNAVAAKIVVLEKAARSGNVNAAKFLLEHADAAQWGRSGTPKMSAEEIDRQFEVINAEPYTDPREYPENRQLGGVQGGPAE